MAEPNPNAPDLSSVPGLSLTPDPSAVADTHSSLDALFKEVVPDPAGTPAAPAAPVKPTIGEGFPEPTDLSTPATPAAPAAPVVPATPAAPAAPVVPVIPAVPALPSATPAAPVTSTPEDFQSVSLPPYSKPATAEQFTKVKMLAQVRIDALAKEKDELATKLKEAEGKVGKLPQEAEAELNELRAFRKKLDVEYDPSFKQFDTQVKQNDESILGKLKEAGVSDEHIKQIRALGVADVDWDGILTKLPSNVKRFVEAKLVQNDDLREQKSRALEEAKKNADQFLTDRDQAHKTQFKQESVQTQEHFRSLLSQASWGKPITLEPTATAEEKAGAEAHNAFLKEVDAALADASNDNSPSMRATLAFGYCSALRFKKEVEALTAGLDAQQKAWNTEKAKMEASIKEKDDFIARIKKSSGASLLSVIATPGQVTAANPNESGANALDRIRSEQQAAQ